MSQINYKKNVKELLLPNAEEHGFNMRILKGQMTKKSLGFFERTVGEVYQCFEIYEDLLREGTVVLLSYPWGNFEVNYSDEKSFREAIETIAKAMNDEGYKALDKKLVEPRIISDDYLFIRDNYLKLSDDFCKAHGVISKDNNSDNLKLVTDSVLAIRGKEYGEVKEEILRIAAFYADALITVSNGQVYWDDDNQVFMIIRDNQYKFVNTLEIVFASYKADAENVAINMIRSSYERLFTKAEKESLWN